jgi:hypothetical protein
MNRILLSAALFLAANFFALTVGRAAEPISGDDFTQLRSLVKPDASEEKWMQVPWLSSLWEARKRAAAEGKPILLWEMDGHPLGCT